MATPPELRIIVAPLDWGMGHATRCIPLIKELQSHGITVIVGGTEQSRQRIKAAGIISEYLDLPAYSIRYHKFLPAWLMVLLQFSKIIKAIKSEKKILNNYLKKNKVDALISDNRYGVFNLKIPSVLITHQVRPKSPFSIFQGITNKFVHNQLKNFNEIWIPDLTAEESISGDLSIPFSGITFKNIGILSRFEASKQLPHQSNSVLAIVSGPEPQASIFQQQLIRLAIRKKVRISIISSSELPENNNLSEDWIRLIHSPNDQDFQRLVSENKFIIMRSGYSGIMDMLRLGRTALLVPTPGQTEQEYLAVRMKEFGFTAISQKNLAELRLPDSFPSGLSAAHSDKGLLTDAVSGLVRTLQ